MVLLPYTRLHPTTSRLANRHAPGHRRVRIDPADVEGYWRLLARVWREPGDLLIIEQDVGIHARVVPGLTTCRQPWCGHPYPIGEQLLICLGCTRFSAELKAEQPDLLDVVGQLSDAGTPPRHWSRVDIRILDTLRGRGYQQHRHDPPVAHYHRYPPG